MRRTRYALSVGLCLFVLVTLGYYYAYASDERLPSLKLETIEGDAKEGAALSLFGSYNRSMESKRLSVTTEGSEYDPRDTIANLLPWERPWTPDSPDLKAILKEHPNFMRGKSASMGWYRDKEMLVYAAADNGGSDGRIRLKVEVLNESSGKTKRYSVAVEDSQSYTYPYTADVQRVGGQLHVLVFMQHTEVADRVRDAIGLNEVWDYVLDLEDGSLLARNNLTEGLKAESGADAELRIAPIAEGSLAAPSEYALIEVTDIKVKQLAHNTQEIDNLGTRLYSYSYRTGERKLLVPFKTSVRGFDFVCTLYGNQVSVQQDGETPGTFAWTLFDVATGEKKADLTVTAKQLGGTDIGTAFIAHGRVYALVYDADSQQGGGGSIAAVLDAATGQVLYRGKAVIADPTRDGDKERSRLEMFYLQLRDES